MNRFASFLRLSLLFVLLAGLVLQPQSTVYAAGFTIEPITWNIVGLDSNDPGTGPYHFPVGVRVCNDTGAVANNVTGTLVWDTGGTATAFEIYERPGTDLALSVTTLAAGACADFYYEVEVSRTFEPYDKTRRYHIEVTSTETGTTKYYSDVPRELYVEHLISQNRNGVTEIYLDTDLIAAGGTMYLQVGQTYDITLNGFTATQGYNQFEAFINLPNTVFRVNSVTTNYAANTSDIVKSTFPQQPVTNYPYLYADACGWDNDPDSPTYRSCIVDSLAKTGGNPVSTTYNVTILPSSITSGALNTLLYDFSGSSYHYNADFGVEYYFQIIDPTDVEISKSFSPRIYNPSSVTHSTMTLTFSNPTGVTLDGIQIKDLFPTTPGAMTLYDTTVGGTCTATVTDYAGNALNVGDVGISVSGITLAANGFCTVTVNVQVAANGDYTNTTEHLYVNATTDTTKTDSDILKANTTPPPPATCGGANPPAITLAGWNFDSIIAGQNLGPINADSNQGDVTNAGAYYGAGSQTYHDSAIVTAATNYFLKDTGGTQYLHPVSPVPSVNNVWGIQAGNVSNAGGWPTSAAPNGTTAPYFEFRVDAGNYGGLQITARGNVQGSWANSGNWYVFSSTNGTTWNQAGTGAWANTTFGNAWGTISSTTSPSNAGTTYYRIILNGASNNKTDPTIFLDNISITGCKNPPAPNFSKAFKDPAGTTDVIAIAQGATSRLIFTIDNTNVSVPGSVNLTNLAFTDALPLGLDFGSVVSNTCNGTVTVTNNTAPTQDTIVLSGGSLLANNSCTIVVNVTGTSAGHYDNITGYLSSTETDTTTKYAEDTLDVVAPPVISKAFSPTSILVNGNSTLTFTVTNPNNFTSLAGVAFTDSGADWPAALSATNGTYVGSCTSGSSGSLSVTGGNSLSLSGGTLAANGSCNFSVPVTSASSGAWTNTTSVVTATGPVSLTGNSDSATLTVNTPQPLLSLNKEVSTDGTNWYKYVGLTIPGSVYYRFTIVNEGETDLTGISVIDVDNPDIVTPCALPATLAIGASASCTVGPIAVNSTPATNPLSNTAQVTSDQITTLPYPPYNSITSTAIYGTESISITKYVTETYFTATGNTLHYRYEVTNNGGYPLVGPVTVHDDKITPDITCQDPTAVGDNDAYFDPGEKVLCPGPASTDFVTYTVTSTDVDNNQVVNTAYGIATLIGGGTINSLDTSKTVPLTALTIDKDTTTPSADVNGNVIYTIVVVNTGVANLTNFQVTDTLPFTSGEYTTPVSVTAAVTSGTISPSTTYNGSGNLLAGTDILTVGATATITITVDLVNATPGTYDNTATAITTETGSIDDDGTIGGDPGTPGIGADPETDEDVTLYAFPILTLQKTIVNDNGGTAVDTNWTLSAAQDATTISGAEGDVAITNAVVTAGTWYLSESGGLVGYTAGAWICTGSADTDPSDGLTLSYGEDVTCTITNNDNAPLLTLLKTVINDNGGTGVATDWTLTATGSSGTPTNLSGTTPMTSGATFKADTYTLSEIGPAGYTASLYSCVKNAGAPVLGNTITLALGDTVTCTINNDDNAVPAIQVVKSSTTTTITAAGQVVPYTFTVTNVGNVTLTNVTVTDANCAAAPAYQSGDTNTNSNLELTETWVYTCSHTVTQAEVDAGGNLSNTVTADSTESGPDTDTLNIPITQAPAMTVNKTATLNDGVVAPSGEVNVGDTITYGFEITNTGNVTLTSVTVSDDLLGSLNCTSIASLAVGAMQSFTCTNNVYTLTQADIDSGSLANTADVSSTETCTGTNDCTDTVNVLLTAVPALTIVKEVSASSSGPWNDTSIVVTVGNTVYYRVRVANNGNIALTNLTVNDSIPACVLVRGPDITGDDDTSFEIGEEWSYSCFVTAVSGTTTNTATADTTETPPSSDTASYTATAALVVDPAISKAGNPTQASVGETVTFTLTVTNQGTVSAPDVMVTDTLPAIFDVVNVTSFYQAGGNAGTISVSTAPAPYTVTVNLGTLNVTDIVIITITTTVNGLGNPPIINRASVSTSDLTDPTANDSDNVRINITAPKLTLPATGFAPDVVTSLPTQPMNMKYAATDVVLEIPSLGVKIPIVGVPKKNGSWDVTWLTKQAGWLEGSAFPSWSGNSVLTSHVYDSNGLPGPFVNLSKLKYGDKIVVHAYGQKYTFEVRTNQVVTPNDTSAFKHEEKSWLTLITCKEYDQKTNTYKERVVVRAVLVSVGWR